MPACVALRSAAALLSASNSSDIRAPVSRFCPTTLYRMSRDSTGSRRARNQNVFPGIKSATFPRVRRVFIGLKLFALSVRCNRCTRDSLVRTAKGYRHDPQQPAARIAPRSPGPAPAAAPQEGRLAGGTPAQALHFPLAPRRRLIRRSARPPPARDLVRTLLRAPRALPLDSLAACPPRPASESC